MRCFLQHVLPKALQRVRHYGWLIAGAVVKCERILALLDWTVPHATRASADPPPRLCPACGGELIWVGT